jgi:hypothetical protein
MSGMKLVTFFVHSGFLFCVICTKCRGQTHKMDICWVAGIISETTRKDFEEIWYQASAYLLTELSPFWEAANCAATKKFPEFYGTRKFITVFTRTLHWSLSWARSIQSILSRPISLRYILILSTHLCLVLPNGLFPSGFPNYILYAFIFATIRAYMSCPSHPPWLHRWLCYSLLIYLITSN